MADRRPGLSDLRESGAIEQNADLILYVFLYRDEVYNDSLQNLERGLAEVKVGKHRSGPTGTIKLRYQEECTRFYDLVQDDR